VKKRAVLFILIISGIYLISTLHLQSQEIKDQQEAPEPDPLFVRATLYPTANLSRYDYNNDVDLYEIRAYVQLRDKTPIGEIIDNAYVYVDSELLDFKIDHYEKRIKVPMEELVEEFELRIGTQDGRIVKDRFKIPTWLIMLNPRPDMVDHTQDLLIKWKFTRFEAPVDVFAYNFKTGEKLFEDLNLYSSEAVLAGKNIPEATIVRIWVMQSWLYKRFLSGPTVAPGSEVILIPWSQVFVRTK
jgi:hypothetical protein